MSYRRLAGVQSTPRVMRGAPVRHGFMFDVPLMERNLGGTAEIANDIALRLSSPLRGLLPRVFDKRPKLALAVMGIAGVLVYRKIRAR